MSFLLIINFFAPKFNLNIELKIRFTQQLQQQQRQKNNQAIVGPACR
jgi:hypothetical protein